MRRRKHGKRIIHVSQQHPHIVVKRHAQKPKPAPKHSDDDGWDWLWAAAAIAVTVCLGLFLIEMLIVAYPWLAALAILGLLVIAVYK